MVMSPVRWGLVAGAVILAGLATYGTGLGLDGPPALERVSISSSGVKGMGASMSASISDDGRYVAFASDAANLVPNDTNLARDVFVHDRQTGATERVSVSSADAEGDGPSGGLLGFPPLGIPRLDGSGRYVVYSSHASNLVAGDDNESSDIFVRDRVAGTTERVSVASDGTPGNDNSVTPSVSADGRYVAFSSRADNLVLDDENGTWDVYVHDRETDATELVSQATDGTPGEASSGFTGAGPPRISADGRHVVFGSIAGNLSEAPDENSVDDIFLRDRVAGTTELVSLASDGSLGNNHSTYGDVSDDGRLVVFASSADNLIDGDANGVSDVYLRDRQLETTVRVTAPAGEPDGPSRFPSISADGSHVVFQSDASNLVGGDDNDAGDVFRYAVVTGAIERVSVPAGGGEAQGASQQADVSEDGSAVVFESAAPDLVSGDSNGAPDVFAWGKALGSPPTPTATPPETETPPPTETPGSLPCSERGDVSADGLTNSVDALFVLQYVAGLLDSLTNPDRADVDGDGGISAIDAAFILQYSAGLLDCLP